MKLFNSFAIIRPRKTAGKLVLGHTILIEKCTHKMDYLQLSLPFSPGELQMGFGKDALGQAGEVKRPGIRLRVEYFNVSRRS